MENIIFLIIGFCLGYLWVKFNDVDVSKFNTFNNDTEKDIHAKDIKWFLSHEGDIQEIDTPNKFNNVEYELRNYRYAYESFNKENLTKSAIENLKEQIQEALFCEDYRLVAKLQEDLNLLNKDLD